MKLDRSNIFYNDKFCAFSLRSYVNVLNYYSYIYIYKKKDGKVFLFKSNFKNNNSKKSYVHVIRTDHSKVD